MRPRFSIQSWMAPAFAVAIAMTFNVLVRAADAAGTKTGGTVTGQVTDKDGKPVANAKVRVTVQNSSKKSGGATTKSSGGSDDAASTASRSPTTQGSGNSGSKTPAVAEGTTDADGKFSIADVPPGDYNVSASVKGQGAGREKVTVKSGETAEVKLKLQEAKPKK
jgi:uncharacterized GH25 family protein